MQHQTPTKQQDLKKLLTSNLKDGILIKSLSKNGNTKLLLEN